MGDEKKSVAIVGAGIFGLSLAVALCERGHTVTVFDRNQYDDNGYSPDEDGVQAASVDHNKILRASYGSKLHYQRLAMESRQAWLDTDKASEDGRLLFDPCGMLRVQPSSELSALERETLANMERDGLRDTQFVKSKPDDRKRAQEQGWEAKLLEFAIPDRADGATFEAVLDSLAGFVKCSKACAHFHQLSQSKGVQFVFGPEEGAFDSLVLDDRKRAKGLRTKDGQVHPADVVVVAAGSYSTQVLPELGYHLESSAGSLATFKIDKKDKTMWKKYSPERFPVITWKSTPRDPAGKDTGSVYVLPRTDEGLVKIGYRGIKFTNFQPTPREAPFSQDGKWSVPLPPAESVCLPQSADEAIRQFVDVFLPDFKGLPYHSTRLCWYTDSLDNSFVVDYVPTFADRSVFVCTGGSGHGAKFLPVLGQHAADILENGDASSSFMRPHWRWRPDAKRSNGLEEGPDGPREISKHDRMCK
ncbi:FAD dependent oxidoreductase [Acaromyces ingoldii]|uniref:FAD dependent oxidoreductase n=1 Tax=Acaromyces ingoldii TaxID=215250 RepID=A0A316YF12_9BASI|nr:FAD dependent oxidoreductase [Acaromyces ingoldii]PWN87701.1 FAD dependent oxidoreductase [Acaromyces ingoldii]